MTYELKLRKGINTEHRELVEKVFKYLEKGTEYRNDKGRFMGKIAVIDGPVHIISDHYFDTEDKQHVIIEVRYMYELVLRLLIDDAGFLHIHHLSDDQWSDRLLTGELQ